MEPLVLIAVALKTYTFRTLEAAIGGLLKREGTAGEVGIQKATAA